MARVMIVDDDEIVTEIVADRLGESDHEVRIVHDGSSALAAIEAGQPDLVILDYNLPGMSGVDVLDRIRADPGLEGLPVMMLTGVRDDALLASAHEKGADDYLRKPVDLEELVLRAEAMLKGAAIARQARPAVADHGEDD